MVFPNSDLMVKPYCILSNIKTHPNIENLTIDEIKNELDLLYEIKDMVTPFTDNYEKVLYEICMRYQKLCLVDKNYIKKCVTFNLVCYKLGRRDNLFISAVANAYPEISKLKSNTQLTYLLIDEIEKLRDCLNNNEEESNSIIY